MGHLNPTMLVNATVHIIGVPRTPSVRLTVLPSQILRPLLSAMLTANASPASPGILHQEHVTLIVLPLVVGSQLPTSTPVDATILISSSNQQLKSALSIASTSPMLLVGFQDQPQGAPAWLDTFGIQLRSVVMRDAIN